MLKIQDLFDPSKQLNRTIESVVTFGAKTVQDLNSEIREYVVTNKNNSAVSVSATKYTITTKVSFKISNLPFTTVVKKSVFGCLVSMFPVRVLLLNTWDCRLTKAY